MKRFIAVLAVLVAVYLIAVPVALAEKYLRTEIDGIVWEIPARTVAEVSASTILKYFCEDKDFRCLKFKSKWYKELVRNILQNDEQIMQFFELKLVFTDDWIQANARSVIPLGTNPVWKIVKK
jgi:hypothetical protein